MTYDCMSDDELTLWREAASRVQGGGRRPCVDCPMAYHLEQKALGLCDSRPIVGSGGVRSFSPSEAVLRRREARRLYRARNLERVRAANRDLYHRKRVQ